MYKKANYKSFLFRLTHIALLSALFFVQLQLRFIESAYNDFSDTPYSVAAASNHTSGITQLNNQDNNSEKETYSKLNKRYQGSNVFLISPAPVIARTVFIISSVRTIYKAPFIEVHSCYISLLRGPPSFSV